MESRISFCKGFPPCRWTSDITTNENRWLLHPERTATPSKPANIILNGIFMVVSYSFFLHYPSNLADAGRQEIIFGSFPVINLETRFKCVSNGAVKIKYGIICIFHGRQSYRLFRWDFPAPLPCSASRHYLAVRRRNISNQLQSEANLCSFGSFRPCGGIPAEDGLSTEDIIFFYFIFGIAQESAP